MSNQNADINPGINRREALRAAGVVAAGLTVGTMPLAAAQGAGLLSKRVLILLNVDLPGATAANITTVTLGLTTAAIGMGVLMSVISDGSLFTAATMNAYDLVVYLPTSTLTLGATRNTVSAAASQAFLSAISKGKGFIAAYCRPPDLAPGAPAGSTTPLQQFLADVPSLGQGIAMAVTGNASTTVKLSDHNANVCGQVVGATPMPLRIVCVTASTTSGNKKVTRPIANLLFSNGGTLLKQVLQYSNG